MTLGKALLSRGHRVTYFGSPEAEEKIRAGGLGFGLLERDNGSTTSVSSIVTSMADASGGKAQKLQRQFDELRWKSILNEGPRTFAAAGVDALAVDQAEAAGGSVAEHLGLPWVSICSGLSLNAEPRVPPFFTTWAYSTSLAASLRNRFAYWVARRMTGWARKLINEHRKKWSLRSFEQLDDTFSPYAQISQQIPQFDFPRLALPASFRYVGPIRSAIPPACDFPWDRLDGRPLIYASLGTMVNKRPHIYRMIAEACLGLKRQLIISLGGGSQPEVYRDLPGAPLLVRFAPQRELLSRAHLTVTPAGLNTTLESLSEGVPLVAIPIAAEQPGTAARIRWTGTGDFIGLSRLTTSKLRWVIQHVLEDSKYADAARQMRSALHPIQGVSRAVEIIETVTQTRRPLGKASPPEAGN